VFLNEKIKIALLPPMYMGIITHSEPATLLPVNQHQRPTAQHSLFDRRTTFVRIRYRFGFQPGRSERPKPGLSGTRQRASEGRKTSRGDIVIGRPALILKKALPSTHDTMSHLYGVDDGEALPFA
jgi:hypothetical protein